MHIADHIPVPDVTRCHKLWEAERKGGFELNVFWGVLESMVSEGSLDQGFKPGGFRKVLNSMASGWF